MDRGNGGTTTSRRRYLAGDPRSTEFREEMIRRRHDTSLAIRKQRKEERLWRRRRPAPNSNVRATANVESLHGLLQKVLEAPHGGGPIVELQHSMAGNVDASNAFLRGLIDEHVATSRALISCLTNHVRSDRSREAYRASLFVLLEISSMAGAAPADRHSYYGRAPPTWLDLILEETPLLPLLLRQLTDHPCDPDLTQTLSYLWGNLLQESDSQILPHILPAWASIVQRLPSTIYLCAAAVRHDHTHYGMTFLQALTPDRIAALFQYATVEQQSLWVDAAWVLEGVSRREQDCVDMLWNNATLLPNLVDCMEYSITTLKEQAWLVPAVQALTNLLTACQSHHVCFLLSNPKFVSVVSTLLEQRHSLPVVTVVSCLLVDAGIRDHPATTVAVPVFMPILLWILVRGPFPWRRDAAWAIYAAISGPTDGLETRNATEIHGELSNIVQTQIAGIGMQHQGMRSPSREELWRALVELLDSPDMDATMAALQLVNRLLRMVPPEINAPLEWDQVGGVERLERLCTQLSSPPNDGGRFLPHQQQQAPSLLHHYCHENVHDYDREWVGTLVCDLLEDFFPDHEEQEARTNMMYDADHDNVTALAAFVATADKSTSSTPPTILSEGPSGSSQANTAVTTTTIMASHVNGRGRGKDRTIPAWMLQ